MTHSAAQRATVLAVESLRGLGTQIRERQSTNQFYSATCRLAKHGFTVQVVLDTNLFEVGNALEAADGVHVADLETLLKTKAATLLRRCSEKDLYDLVWLFTQFSDLNAAELIPLGAQIDGGMQAESLLISLVGTTLDASSCGFSNSQSAEDVLNEIESLKSQLESAFDRAARGQPTPTIGELIRRLGKQRRR